MAVIALIAEVNFLFLLFFRQNTWFSKYPYPTTINKPALSTCMLIKSTADLPPQTHLSYSHPSYIQTYIYIYIYIYAHILLDTHTHTHTHKYIYIHCTYTSGHTHTHTNIYIYTLTLKYVMYIYVYVYILSTET